MNSQAEERPYPWEQGPPQAGDLLIMYLPEGEPLPAGWTMPDDATDVCWRIATGNDIPDHLWASVRVTS